MLELKQLELAVALKHGHSNDEALKAVTNVNTGDETKESIKTKLGAVTKAADGYLSKEDFALFLNNIALTALPSTSGSYIGKTITVFNLGYTTSAVGEVVYLDSDGTWKIAGKGVTASFGKMLGIILEVKNQGQAVTIGLPGVILNSNNFPDMTIGEVYYLSDSGAVSSTTTTVEDECIIIIGKALGTKVLLFSPSNDYVIYKA